MKRRLDAAVRPVSLETSRSRPHLRKTAVNIPPFRCCSTTPPAPCLLPPRGVIQREAEWLRRWSGGVKRGGGAAV